MCCQCGCRSLRLSSELITVVSQCGLNNFSKVAACCFLPGQLKINAWTRIFPLRNFLGAIIPSVCAPQYHIFLQGRCLKPCSLPAIASTDGANLSVIRTREVFPYFL